MNRGMFQRVASSMSRPILPEFVPPGVPVTALPIYAHQASDAGARPYADIESIYGATDSSVATATQGGSDPAQAQLVIQTPRLVNDWRTVDSATVTLHDSATGTGTVTWEARTPGGAYRQIASTAAPYDRLASGLSVALLPDEVAQGCELRATHDVPTGTGTHSVDAVALAVDGTPEPVVYPATLYDGVVDDYETGTIPSPETGMLLLVVREQSDVASGSLSVAGDIGGANAVQFIQAYQQGPTEQRTRVEVFSRNPDALITENAGRNATVGSCAVAFSESKNLTFAALFDDGAVQQFGLGDAPAVRTLTDYTLTGRRGTQRPKGKRAILAAYPGQFDLTLYDTAMRFIDPRGRIRPANDAPNAIVHLANGNPASNGGSAAVTTIGSPTPGQEIIIP